MDILISSNLERLLFHLSGGDSEEINRLFTLLNETGEYTVSKEMLDKITSVFSAGCCDDTVTKLTISDTFEKYGYLSDTHTAVALSVYNDYRKTTGDETPAVIASTASPYKFSAAVLSALEKKDVDGMNDFEMLSRIEEISGTSAPVQLKSLKGASPRFTGICTKEEMQNAVYSLLGI